MNGEVGLEIANKLYATLSNVIIYRQKNKTSPKGEEKVQKTL